jgi:hypothetical protein
MTILLSAELVDTEPVTLSDAGRPKVERAIRKKRHRKHGS